MGLWSRIACSRPLAFASSASADFCAVMSRDVIVAPAMLPSRTTGLKVDS